MGKVKVEIFHKLGLSSVSLWTSDNSKGNPEVISGQYLQLHIKQSLIVTTWQDSRSLSYVSLSSGAIVCIASWILSNSRGISPSFLKGIYIEHHSVYHSFFKIHNFYFPCSSCHPGQLDGSWKWDAEFFQLWSQYFQLFHILPYLHYSLYDCLPFPLLYLSTNLSISDIDSNLVNNCSTWSFLSTPLNDTFGCITDSG